MGHDNEFRIKQMASVGRKFVPFPIRCNVVGARQTFRELSPYIGRYSDAAFPRHRPLYQILDALFKRVAAEPAIANRLLESNLVVRFLAPCDWATGGDVPIPYNRALENAALSEVEDILSAMRELV